MPVDCRVQGGSSVGHGQAVVRVGHRAQALLEFVALAALRPGSPDRFRRTPDAAPNSAASAVKAAAAAAADPSGSASAVAKRGGRRRRRPERKMARRRRFGDQSRRQAHAVYLNQRRRIFLLRFGRAHRGDRTHETQVPIAATSAAGP